MNDRLHYLEAFGGDGVGRDRQAIFNALVACLTAEETCRALDMRFEQPYRKRRVLLRQIQLHMRHDLLPCHTELLAALERGITDLPGSKRKSAAGTLLRLAEALGADVEHKILERLSRSSNATVRGQVYRRVKELPESVFPNYIVVALQSFGDFEAARLIVVRGSLELLTLNFTELERVLASAGYLLSRLFLRLSGQPPADLTRLREIDAISHAYVCTKLGIVLPPGEMVALYRANMFTERSGLVVWCCGQMGHWDALVEISRLAEDPPEDILEAFYEKRP